MKPGRAKIILLPLLFSLLLGLQARAQPYEHAAGIRAGYSSGLSYKGFFLHRITAVQADVYYNNHGLNLAAFYCWNPELGRSSRFIAFAGPGIFGGQWDGEPSIGIAAVAGIEYVTRKVPLNFGFTWRPMFNIYRETAPDFLDFGFTVRYRFSL